MVTAKEKLIKKALGTVELPISVLNDRITFPWFLVDSDGDTVSAYSQFIAALCKTAKEKKRITAKAPKSGFENERFSMRVWLIGLGMVGAEFSMARKLMMKNLDGNSGWHYGKPEKIVPVTEESEVQFNE